LQTKKYVIVVDDDASMLKSMRRLLKAHGFESEPFDSVVALRGHARFDRAFCIVLDINLGDGSGIDLRRQLADDGISLPVIYVTGNDNSRIRKAALESGCVAYLTKPFTAKSLIDPISKLAAAA